MSDFRGKKIFVTGATGFIGGRLVERLVLEHGAEVVALVRQFKSAPRLARFGVKMVAGDVGDIESLREGIQGCHYVVHCAVSFSGSKADRKKIAIEGTRNVCTIALEQRVEGFVHMGTISTYGEHRDGSLDERASKRPKDAYGKAKLCADRVVKEFSDKGLPAVILEPTIVFGPWSFWSRYPFIQTAQGRALLPRQGEGLCNAVYVDDVVSAIFCALVSPEARGKNYLVTADDAITWAEFFELHLGVEFEEGVGLMDSKELGKLLSKEKWIVPFGRIKNRLRSDRELRREILDLPILRELMSVATGVFPGAQDKMMGRVKGRKGVKAPVSVRPTKNVLPIRDHLSILSSRVDVQNDRAKADLGFQPAWDAARGAQMTQEWLEWANVSS